MEPERGGTRSELSGHGRDVVQARDVSGGIHFHQPSRPETVIAPRQLPADVAGFVGREADLALLDRLAVRHTDQGRTVVISTIAGTAGVGKTTLATHWAHRVSQDFPDGQLHINLRGYDPGPPVTADQALERFLVALGVPPGRIPDDTDERAALYRSLLADRRMLIVLDNAATAGQVRPLLPGSTDSVVIVTSRDRLSGLVANNGARRVNLDVLTEVEAVDLLRSTMREYRLSDSAEDLAELARLCARLPLALRVAAERAAARPLMPLPELLANLRNESSLWDELSAGDDESDTVSAIFAWSYRALSPEAAGLFRLLGLHPGPNISAHAAAALAGIQVYAARRLLDVLTAAHLLSSPAYDRFQFHDLLRAYASSKAMTEEPVALREDALARLCHWYLKAMSVLAQIHDALYADDWDVVPPAEDRAALPPLDNYEQVMSWFVAELDNVIAIGRAAHDHGFDDVAWMLPALLRTPYLDRFPAAGWIPMADSALESARRIPDDRGVAVTQTGLGIAYRRTQQLDRAVQVTEAALDAATRINDAHQTVAALTMLGHAHRRGRRLDEAVSAYARGLDVANGENLRLWVVWTEIGMAQALQDAGDLAGSQARIEKVLKLLQPGESPGARSECLWVLAGVERERGRLEQALNHIQAALELAYDSKNVNYECECEIELGRVLVAMGRHHDALTPLQHATTMSRSLGDRSTEAMALDQTGSVFAQLDREQEAVEFHTMAVRMHRELDDAWRLACALRNQGTALKRAGQNASGNASLHEALDLLSGFTDQRATLLRDSIESATS